jgi:hypothetical protein
LERSGRLIDAVTFYERMRDEGTSEADKRFAWTRWLVCKERQLQHELAQGARKKAEGIQRDIRRVQNELSISSVAELDKFPRLRPLNRRESNAKHESPMRTPGPGGEASSEAAPDSAVAPIDESCAAVVGPFKIDISRKAGRINITNTDSLEMAFFRGTDSFCGGEGDFKIDESGGWTSDRWDMALTKAGPPSAGTVTVALRRLGLAVVVRMDRDPS